jgi:hypothetical protein
MAIKPPDGHLNWVTDDAAGKYIAPSAAKRLQGWVQEEKPPFQYFNWAWRLIDRWLKWSEAQSDENSAAISANAQAIAANALAIADETTARADADSSHAALTNPHGATPTPTANRVAMFSSSGRLQSGAAASANNDVVRKVDVPDQVAAIGFGAVGTYAFLAHATPGTALSAGYTFPGADLRYTGIAFASGDWFGPVYMGGGLATPPGTWRAMGYCGGYGGRHSATLFLRIS